MRKGTNKLKTLPNKFESTVSKVADRILAHLKTQQHMVDMSLEGIIPVWSSVYVNSFPFSLLVWSMCSSPLFGTPLIHMLFREALNV